MKCLQCGKVNEDRLNAEGAIVIFAEPTDERAYPVLVVYGTKNQAAIDTHRRLEFCSTDCLVTYINNWRDGVKASEKRE